MQRLVTQRMAKIQLKRVERLTRELLQQRYGLCARPRGTVRRQP